MEKTEQATRKAVANLWDRIFDVDTPDILAINTLCIFGESSEDAHDALCGDIVANFAFGRKVAPGASALFALNGLTANIRTAFDFALVIAVLSDDAEGVKALAPAAHPIVGLTAKILPKAEFSEALLSIRAEAWDALAAHVAELPLSDEDRSIMQAVLDED